MTPLVPIRARLATALAFALVGCGEPRAVRPHQASETCPLKTPGEWQAFVERTTLDESWVKTCSDLQNCGELLAAFVDHVEADVVGVFDSCQADLRDNPTIEQCTEHLRRYVPAYLAQHVDDSYGFKQDNLSYFAAQTEADKPAGMMDPPRQILEALPERSAIEGAARENGFPFLTHDSGLGGTRLFVTIADPEGRFDQWLLFGLDEGATHVDSPAIMSFIGVQKKDADGGALPKVRLHFRDYLVSEAGGAWQLGLPPTFGGKCYACHGSGLRLLLPGAASAAMNERLLSYGLPDWGATLDPADHGPALGASLGCTSCHDGALRGRLTVSTSEGMLRQKVVDQLSMQSPVGGRPVPDEAAMALLERMAGGETLSVDEQSELDRARARHWADYEALVSERFPAWRAWVLERRCD